MQSQTTPIPTDGRRRRWPLRLATAAVALCGLAVFAPSATAAELATYDGKVKIKGAPVTLTCTSVFPMGCYPGEGNAVTIDIKFHRRFTSVQEVCLTFHFVDDVIDPGEFVDLFTFNISPEDPGSGFASGTQPVADPTACLGASDLVFSAFADGRQEVTAFMLLGSATLASVEATLTGVQEQGVGGDQRPIQG